MEQNKRGFNPNFTFAQPFKGKSLNIRHVKLEKEDFRSEADICDEIGSVLHDISDKENSAGNISGDEEAKESRVDDVPRIENQEGAACLSSTNNIPGPDKISELKLPENIFLPKFAFKDSDVVHKEIKNEGYSVEQCIDTLNQYVKDMKREIHKLSSDLSLNEHEISSLKKEIQNIFTKYNEESELNEENLVELSKCTKLIEKYEKVEKRLMKPQKRKSAGFR
jgi:SMC interacting uncharacterized protein involved in chromosome segregation